MPLPLNRVFFCLLFTVLPLALSFAQSGSTPIHQAPIWSGKPDAAAFERMENDHIAAAKKSIDALVALKGPRTLANTLQLYDAAIRDLDTASYLAGLMEHVHPEAAFRDKATEMKREASAAGTALSLNAEAYHALAGLDLSKADPATKHYMERTLLEFRLAGVDKDEATRTKIKQLRDQLTELQSKFERNIADDRKVVAVDDAKELEGMPQDYIERHKPGADGKILISTDYPDYLPAQKFAKSDALRRKLYMAFTNRAYPVNREVLLDMARIRQQLAALLGYSNWADYNAADAMIGHGPRIAEFIQEVDTAARPIADREFQMLLAEKHKDSPDAKSMVRYENSYYSELLRRAQFDFDSASVRPYLPYDSVKKGILATAEKLFNLQFKQVQVAAWSPDVETYDVYDHGQMVGRFYLDMHPREGKFKHAEMVQVLDGIAGKQLPEATLVCNFPAPTATDAGLMEFGDVETFFHEFGHLMHWILAGRQHWAGVSGLNMEWDFVEAPSQMLENMLRSYKVLVSFAHHYKTGAPLPEPLFAKLKRAEAFGRGIWAQQQNSYTDVSYEIYSRDPSKVDPDAIFLEATRKYTPFEELPDTHNSESFGHLAGYSSAYYTYLWDKVIAQDFYAQFDQSDPLAGGVPMRYRHAVLEPGGSVSASTLVHNFLGREQNTKAFQEWLGEEFKQGGKGSAGSN